MTKLITLLQSYRFQPGEINKRVNNSISNNSSMIQQKEQYQVWGPTNYMKIMTLCHIGNNNDFLNI